MTPSNATNVAGYEWFALDSADEATTKKTSIGTGESITITTALVGKYIQVVATDNEGKTYSSNITNAVSKDESANVSLIDEYGLQDDGTGIVGDVLRISYGADFGTPTAITWYKNGSVLTTAGSGNDGVGGLLSLRVTASVGIGKYYATVVANGKTYTTNEIEITNKEDAAVITGFTIEDDYTDGTDIRYATNDTKAVATITLNKNYPGVFQIWKSTDTKYNTEIENLKTAAAAANLPAVANANPTDGNSIITADAATNYNMLDKAAGAGLGYINADGSVTYKFVMGAATNKTRGDSYVVTFDQTSVTTDNPKTGTANKFETAVTVPYIKAPGSIAITKVSNGNYPEVSFYDEDGELMTWFRGEKAVLTDSGFADIEIYGATSKTTDTTKATALGVADATANALFKGVWTSNKLANSSAYWFATAKTKAGIFAKDAKEYTSEAVPVAQDAASDIDLVESKTVGTTAVVSFSNLRSKGTVYVVRGMYIESNGSAGWDKDYGSTPAAIYAGYNEGVLTSNTVSAQVEAGTASVEIENAIGKYEGKATTTTNDNYNADNYIAIFVPENEEDYGMVYTDGAFSTDPYTSATATTTIKSALKVTPVATTAKYYEAGTNAFTFTGNNTDITTGGDKIWAYDQFGERITSALADVANKTAKVTPVNTTSTNTESAKAKYSVSAGNVAIVLTPGSGVDMNDGFEVEVLGTTFKVIATKAYANAGATAAAGALDTYANISLGAQKLKAGTVTTKNVSTAADLKTALAAPGMESVNIVSNIETTETLTVPTTVTLNVANGVTFTIKHAFTDNGVVTNSGTIINNDAMTIATTGTVNNESGATFTNGTGTGVTNAGTFNNRSGATLTYGTNWTATKVVLNAGTITDAVATSVTTTASADGTAATAATTNTSTTASVTEGVATALTVTTQLYALDQKGALVTKAVTDETTNVIIALSTGQTASAANYAASYSIGTDGKVTFKVTIPTSNTENTDHLYITALGCEEDATITAIVAG